MDSPDLYDHSRVTALVSAMLDAAKGVYGDSGRYNLVEVCEAAMVVARSASAMISERTGKAQEGAEKDPD